MDADVGETRFRGMAVSDRTIITRAFVCEDCPNECEAIEILDADRRCGWRHRRPLREVVALYRNPGTC
jgi:hypothetical protein